jgi:hypothetical protein
MARLALGTALGPDNQRKEDPVTKILAYARSNAIALLALFVALGGTSYAAIAIPKNSVGSRQLRNRAVTESKLGKRSVTAANLNGKSIAGYVADWAQIGPDGSVFGANPHVTVTVPSPGRGQYFVTWNRRIPPRCFPFSSVTNAIQPGYATTIFRGVFAKPFAGVNVQTYDATGALAPEAFSVAIICP